MTTASLRPSSANLCIGLLAAVNGLSAWAANLPRPFGATTVTASIGDRMASELAAARTAQERDAHDGADPQRSDGAPPIEPGRGDAED